MGWDGKPTVLTSDGKIYFRDAEMIFHRKYYPTGTPGEWPVNPETGEKLEMEPMYQLHEQHGHFYSPVVLAFAILAAWLIFGIGLLIFY